MSTLLKLNTAAEIMKEGSLNYIARPNIRKLMKFHFAMSAITPALALNLEDIEISHNLSVT